MFFTVYRTTNLVNGRFYVGVHKTEDPHDSYLGSGKALRRAIAKYGEENFQKSIWLVTESAIEAFNLEKALVEEARTNRLCYNLRCGGSGGFDYINSTGLNGNGFKTAESRRKSGETYRKRLLEDPEKLRKAQEWIAAIRKLTDPEKREERRKKAVAKWKGSRHTDEARKAMSLKRMGNKQRLGTHWLHKGDVSKVVDASQVEGHLADGWGPGRKRIEKLNLRSFYPQRPAHHLLAKEGTSWCSGHRDYLPVERFHKDCNTPNGLKKICIDCRKERRKGKRW